MLGLALKVGELNYAVLEQLDHAHTETFGAPAPAPVRLHPLKGKAILVSGHDLHDLYHSSSRPKAWASTSTPTARCCPPTAIPSSSFKHLAGNYGGAWQDQANEFAGSPARS